MQEVELSEHEEKPLPSHHWQPLTAPHVVQVVWGRQGSDKEQLETMLPKQPPGATQEAPVRVLSHHWHLVA